jgi:hypothetical protein
MPSLTRRRWLAGVGVLAAAAGGAAIGALTASSGDGDSATPRPGPPAPLLSALDRERTLLAAVQAAAENAALASVTGPLVADHREHEATLGGLLATYPRPSASASESLSAPPPAAPTSVATLRQAEGAAAEEAAAESAAAHGALAAVLASISACEASHAAWLQ